MCNRSMRRPPTRKRLSGGDRRMSVYSPGRPLFLLGLAGGTSSEVGRDCVPMRSRPEARDSAHTFPFQDFAP